MNRDLGVQPLIEIMKENHLEASNLVAASEKQLTYKMISRACKGRRLTPHTQEKVCEALNKASGKDFKVTEIFNY